MYVHQFVMLRGRNLKLNRGCGRVASSGRSLRARTRKGCVFRTNAKTRVVMLLYSRFYMCCTSDGKPSTRCDQLSLARDARQFAISQENKDRRLLRRPEISGAETAASAKDRRLLRRPEIDDYCVGQTASPQSEELTSARDPSANPQKANVMEY